MNYLRAHNKNGGYIALMATIIISLVLLVMIVNEGFAGWMTRFVVLGTEAKEQANALAEGCADQALALLITDPNYLGNSTSNTPGGDCKVFAISPTDLQAGLVTIKTQAVVRDAFANLELLQSVNNIHLGSIPTAPTYGTLIVQTLVSNPPTGPQKTPADFTMQVSGPSGITPTGGTFAGSGSGVIVRIPTPLSAPISNYSVSEVPLPGYASLSTTDCSGTIKGGDIKSCTFSNSPVTTTLTVIVNVSNNDGTGTAQPSTIPLYIDGAPATLGQAYTQNPGAHTVNATIPSGYSASSWGYQCDSVGNTTLSVGDNKICIINIDDNPPPAPICAETVMMLDRSWSMFGNSQWIPDEKTAAKALVDLYAGVPNIHPLLGVGRFGDVATGRSAEIVSQLSNAYTAIKTAIDNALPQNPISYTNLSAAITKGNEELNSVRHQAGKEQVLILISDGDPNEPTSGSTLSTGFLVPTANVQNGSGDLWQNATAAYAVGGGEATDQASAGHRHRFYNFNLPTLPSGATIQGIELVADAWATTSTMVTGPTSNVQKAPSALLAGGQWATGASAYASDNTYATSATINQQQGFGNFGFAIPSNATITGVQVSTEAKVSGSTPTNTSTLYPAGQGSDSSWNGNEGDVDETNTPSCSSSDRIDSNNNGNRESVDIDLSSIPNNAIVTSVQVLTWDQGSINGQYQSFVYVNGVRTNSATITVTGTSNCTSRTQTIDIPDFTKINNNALEVGVQKVGNTTVQVGAIRAIVTYVNPATGGLSVALSSNNGGSYTAAKTVSLTATEAVLTPSGNSATDMWGRSWSPSDFNNGNFVARVQNTTATGFTTSLDQVLVTVNYTTPTPASADCELRADLSWNGGSNWTSEKSQTISESPASYTFGSPTDDWSGHTWSASDFTNTNFRARVRSADPGSACDNVSVERLDALKLQVTYFAPVTATDAALAAADAAKLAGTDIFTIYFGNGNPNLLAQLASGATANAGHQNGSSNNLSGTPVTTDTGLKSPTATRSPQNWANPTNAFSSNNAYTTSNVEAQEQGYSNFGFGISAGSTIVGIQVQAEAKSSDSSGCELQTMLSWNGGTNYTSATDGNLSGNDSIITLGGSNSLWGRTWSASDFSDTNFVLKFRFDDSSNSSCNNATVSVDQVQVRVYVAGAIPENGDGDNFFISPTSADMKGIFEFIGNQVCPAINNVGAATPPTTATLLVITRTDSGDQISPVVSVTATNPSTSGYTATNITSSLPNQTTITVDPGNYNITQSATAGYTQSRTDSCSSALSTSVAAGEARTCVLTNTKVPPPPPPPNLTITPGSWQEVPDTTP